MTSHDHMSQIVQYTLQALSSTLTHLSSRRDSEQNLGDGLRDSGGSSGTGGGHRHGAEGACWRDNDLLNQSPHKSSSESSLIQKNITKKALYCSKKIQKIGTWGSESSLICCTLLVMVIQKMGLLNHIIILLHNISCA